MNRTYNFNAGPSALPYEVLRKAQAEFTNFKNTGMSIMELSHRSKEYDDVHENARKDVKELLHIPNDYHVLFLQGGASLQFSMIPLNFLHPSSTAHYVLTGSWSEKALAEAEKIGSTSVLASGRDNEYRHIPSPIDLNSINDSSYVHITSNNTIYGTEWHSYPMLYDIPLLADMSSDILSKEIDINQFSMIYAGAQKNLGPAGVTVVIIKDEFLKMSSGNIPTMLDYKTHVKKNSLYNTPPTFSIYMLSLVLEWTKEQGGVSEIEKRNKKKASLLYESIEDSNGFYSAHAVKDSRSTMNVVFNLPTEYLTKKFLREANDNGFIGLGGHRSVGGCRASLYNAVPFEWVERLTTFMKRFKATN